MDWGGWILEGDYKKLEEIELGVWIEIKELKKKKGGEDCRVLIPFKIINKKLYR